MRQFHIFLQTIIKSIEVGYQLFLALLIVTLSFEYLNLKAEMDAKEVMDCENKVCLDGIKYWIAGLFVFMWFHIMHINICSNCRLAARTKQPFCCYICWSPLNVLICKFQNNKGCQDICMDKCIRPNTIAKAIVMPAFAIGFRV